MGSFLSFGNHAVACSRGRETDDMSPSFPSSRFAVRHHSNVPGAFLSTMSFQDARCGTAFPGNACPTVQDWGQVCSFQGKNCGGFGAFTKNNRCMLCISPSSLSPFSVHVSMECRFSDKVAPVAEATASCATDPPMREGNGRRSCS